MGRQPAKIRDANPATACAAAIAERKLFRLFSGFAFLLLLLCTPMLSAQAGVITTAAGPSLNDSSVSGAYFLEPTGVAIDTTGNIYTADPYNCVVWKTRYGTTSVFAGVLPSTPDTCVGGTITNVATTTTLAYPSAVAQCNGNVFVVSNGLDPFVVGGGVNDTGGTVYEVTLSGSLSTLPLPSTGGGAGAGPLHPVAVACDAGGNVYVSSYFYIADGGFASNVNEFSPLIGGGWTTGAPVNGLFDQAYTALAVNPTNGDLYGILAGSAGAGWLGRPMFDFGSIWDITQNATGLASNNTFDNPSALAIDSNGNFYIAVGQQGYELASYVDYVLPDGTTTVIAGTGSLGYSGNGGLSTQAEVYGVSGIALDATNSNIYLADSGNQVVRRIHSLTAGPSVLNLVPQSAPQSSSATYGSLQGTLNPVTGNFYYVTGTNTVNVINTGANVISPGYERLIASISVGAVGPAPNGSALTMVVDSTRNLVYVSNTSDGNLYVINGSTHTVVGSVALDNSNARLLAVDTALNEVYAGGPNATKVSAVRGGISPQLIGNAGYPVNSLSVDAATDVVYAVADSGAGGAQQEAFITMTPDPVTGVLAASITTFPADEVIVQPAFIANSIAADPLTGSLIASGAASINTGFAQGYYVYDIFQFNPTFETAPVLYTWPPLTTSLDIPNRAFYVTDFDGLLSDPSSHAAMVTGIDGVAAQNNSLLSVAIPAFGSGATPASPHVYDAEPVTSSYQAWISGSDATDGGFVRLWDAGTQKVTLSASIPANGGGHLFVNPNAQAAYLLDEVNGQLWLINTPQWTPTPEPLLSQVTGAQSVTISATHSGDAVYYTLDGTPPGLQSTPCSSPCMVGLTVGEFTTINAIEVAAVSSMQIASNVEQGVFTEPAATHLAIVLSPNPTTGAALTATATITSSGGISTVTGSVSFTATPSGSSTPVSLCSGVSITNNMGSWQAVCNFVEDYAGSYTVAAAYSGDELNQASSNTTPLTVVQGTTPILFTISDPGSAIAINANNSAGLAYNAVLNSDSSVSLLLDGAILRGQGCPAFASLSGSVTSGAIFVDFANSTIYLAMITGNGLYAAYESINQTTGACTQGPLLPLSNASYGTLQMDVDPTAFSSQLGNMYVMMAYGGGITDALYIVPTAPWSVSSLPTPAELTLDYSTQYGPMVADSSNHQLYINDLGGSAYGTVGTYATGGFFVYDPNHSATPASNLQHVLGYNNAGKPTTLNVGTLLDNGAGKLVLVNENPSASANLSVPITILDTTQFSFFTNTTNPFTYNSDVDITPGAGLSTISAVSQYTAIGGADIDTANNVVYAFGFNSSLLTTPGLLLEYNLSPSASPQETVLSGSAAMPNLGSSVPWSRMNYNPVSTELALSASVYSSGGFALTSPLCAGTPLSLTQVAGSAANPVLVGYPVVNTTSGYVYAIQSGAIDYVAPPPGCGAFPTYTIGGGVSGLASGTSVTLLDNGGDPVTVTYPATGFTFPTALDSGVMYAITVGSQPTGATCTVTNGSGTVASSNITSVSVTCSSSVSGPAQVTDNETIMVSDSEAFPDVVDSEPITVMDSEVVTAYNAITIAPSPATFNASNGDGYATYAYSVPFAAAGGIGTLSLTESGALPTGITFVNGLLSGTPAASTVGNTYMFSVTAKDADGDSVTVQGYSLSIQSASAYPAMVMDNETITVSDAETFPDVVDSESITVTDMVSVTTGPIITGPATLPVGILNVAYPATTIMASGGSGTYTWSATGLPAGLSISATGVISGTPTTSAGSPFAVAVTVTDTSSNTATKNYSLIIGASSLVITGPASLPAGVVGTQYQATTIMASGDSGTYTWSATGLPAGLNISATGVISGTPTTSAGSPFAVAVTVTDTNSNTATKNYSLTVTASAPSVSCGNPTIKFSGDSGTATFTCTATGLTQPLTIALECNLPTEPSQFANFACSFSPNSLNFTSSSTPPYTASTTLTIQPVKNTSAFLERKSRPWSVSSGRVVLGAVLWLPTWALVVRRKKGKSKWGVLLMLILFGGLPLITSCVGKSKGPATPPSGSYQGSMVLTGPGLNETINFTIQVP